MLQPAVPMLKTRVPGKKFQRLFFDGIDLQSSRCAVTEAIEFPVLIDADKAEARLA